MSDVDRAIEIVEARRQVHVDWVDYQESNPDSCHGESGVGGREATA